MVDLTRLGHDSCCGFIHLAGNGLILANDLGTDGMVDRVEKGEEAAGDTLFVWWT